MIVNGIRAGIDHDLITRLGLINRILNRGMISLARWPHCNRGSKAWRRCCQDQQTSCHEEFDSHKAPRDFLPETMSVVI